MTDIHIHLDRIEKTVIQILDTVKEERSPIDNRWLPEPQAMKILNRTKRGMKDLRTRNIVRTSTATGRNFLYYKSDLENFIFDHSAVRKKKNYPNQARKVE
jgi:hypothetical protein